MDLDAVIAQLIEKRRELGGDAECGLFDRASEHDFPIQAVTVLDGAAWLEF